ncbi:MAG: SufD family Fe-S cluster assembly protein, partial [Candidatus Micrarchaeota archaeon]
GSDFKYGGINLLGGGAVSLMQRKIVLGKNANSASASGFFGGMHTISATDTVMEGEGSSGEDFGVVFGTGEQKFDITSNISNIGKNTSGKVVVKGIYQEKARGLFKGMAYIGKDAKGANSYLAGHSMLMGRETSSDAIPALQIENNNVKATHSASVAQIDGEQLFYLKSRGIPEEAAKRMIAEGFLEPLLGQMAIRGMGNKLKTIFELKWSGEGMGALERKIRELEQTEMGIETPEGKAGNKQEIIAGKKVFEGHYKYRK